MGAHAVHRTAETSRTAFGEARRDRVTQERALFALYRQHPEGLSDREVAAHMDLTCALASARRNGLDKRLADTEWELCMVRKAKDPITYKTVQHWTVRRKNANCGQGKLF